MEYESLLALVKTRHSCCQFKPEPKPGAYVDKIIEAARWAPSGANSQPWEYDMTKFRTVEEIDEFIGAIRKHRT